MCLNRKGFLQKTFIIAITPNIDVDGIFSISPDGANMR